MREPTSQIHKFETFRDCILWISDNEETPPFICDMNVIIEEYYKIVKFGHSTPNYYVCCERCISVVRTQYEAWRISEKTTDQKILPWKNWYTYFYNRLSTFFNLKVHQVTRGKPQQETPRI
jgi:hypothetical protein